MATTVRLRWTGDPYLANLKQHIATKLRAAASITSAQVMNRLSRPFPPAGRLGQPPARRTGTLQAGMSSATVATQGNKVTMTIGARAPAYAPAVLAKHGPKAIRELAVKNAKAALRAK